MGFQVIRVEKLKSAARVSQRLRHALRDRTPNNADPEKDSKNYYWVPGLSVAQTAKLPQGERAPRSLAYWRDRLPQKFRKDAVQAIEVLVSLSSKDVARVSAMSKDKQYYFKDSLDWVVKRFGGDKNLLGWAIHNDETTPHLSVFMVPLTTVKQKVRFKDEYRKVEVLSAKQFIDGPKDLAQIQTDFHNEVSKQYGLERGREKSPARHTSIKEFYELGAEAMRQKQLDLEKKRLEAEARKKRQKELGL